MAKTRTSLLVLRPTIPLVPKLLTIKILPQKKMLWKNIENSLSYGQKTSKNANFHFTPC